MKPTGRLLILLIFGFLLFFFSGCANKEQPDEEDRPGIDQQDEPEPPNETIYIPYYDYDVELISYMLVNDQIIMRTTGKEARVISIDLQTGAVLWSNELRENGFDTAFVGIVEAEQYVEWLVYEGALIHPVVNRSDSQLYLEKLDISSGELIWRQPCSTGFDKYKWWTLKHVDERLVVRSTGFESNEDITAVHSIQSGERLYSLQGPSIQDEHSLYVFSTFENGSSSNRLTHYNLSSGEKRWESTVNVEPSTRLVSSEAFDGGDTILYCLQTEELATVIALSKAGGKLLWKRDGFRIYRSFYDRVTHEVGRLEGETVILYSENQVLFVNKNTGQEVKSLSMDNPSVATHGGKVFLSDGDRLQVFDLTTTDLLWEKNVGGAITICGDQILLCSEDKLHALQLSKGSLLWEKKIMKPRLLLRRPGALWVSSDTSPEIWGVQEGILFALDPKTGKEISSSKFSWMAGGPGSWPIRMVTSNAASCKIDYLPYGGLLTSEQGAAERTYITLDTNISGTKVFNADTGKEIWNLENLRSQLMGSGDDLFLKIAYYHEYCLSAGREFLLLEQKTGEMLTNLTNKGIPVTIAGNQLVVEQRSE